MIAREKAQQTRCNSVPPHFIVHFRLLLSLLIPYEIFQSMNSVTKPDEQPDPIDKGKRRVQEATERTPLLTGASPSFVPPDDPPTPVLARRRLRSKLTFVFFVSLSVCVAVVLAVLYSYASYALSSSPEDLLNDALVIRGPDRVDVLNLTSDGGIWVNVEGRIGVDAGSIIGVNRGPDNDGFFRNIWKSMGRWGVRRVDRISVNLTTINISPEHDPSTILTSVESSPVEVPLTADPPSDVKSWLTKVYIPLLIRPTSNTSALIQFVRDAWRHGSVAVQVDVGRVVVRGGALDEYSWKRKLWGEATNIKTALRIISESCNYAICPSNHITIQSHHSQDCLTRAATPPSPLYRSLLPSSHLACPLNPMISHSMHRPPL